MAQHELNVERREETGKGPARRLRRRGFIPAVLYGQDKPAIALAVPSADLQRILHSEKGVNTVFDLALGGTEQRRAAMVKDYQLDPLTDRLIHADFVRIVADQEVLVPVHLELVGEPQGVKNEGGHLDHMLRELEVTCLPKDIPAVIKVDVAALHLGQVLHVGDITLPERVRTDVEPTVAICAVHRPRVEAEKAAEEGAPEEAAEGAEGAEATAEAQPAGEEASKSE